MRWLARMWGYSFTLIVATIGLGVGLGEIFYAHHTVGTLPLVYLTVAGAVLLMTPFFAWVLSSRTATPIPVYRPAGLGRRYWGLVTVALFLLIGVDMVTTYYAAGAVGSHHESNPIMKWALEGGTGVLVTVNAVATVALIGFFAGLERASQRIDLPMRRWYRTGLEVWLFTLIAGAVLVAANNVVVILFQKSLL